MGFSDRTLKVLSDANAQEIFANIDVEFSDVDAGKSGAAGTIDIFPSTASKGKLTYSMVDNTNDVTTTITNKAQAAAQTYSIPDCAADADFVMDELAQTIAGAKTHTDDIIMNTADLLIGDTDSLDFGDATGGDVSFAWDATNLNILPAADNTGQILFGNGTVDIDVKIFMGTTTEFVLFDVSGQTVDFGADGKGVDLRLFGETASSLVFFDQSADQLNIDAVTLELDNSKLGEYWRKDPVTKTADYTLLESDSGTIFDNTGDADAINFTLPAVSNTGWHAWFFVVVDEELKITSAAGNDMVLDNDATASSLAFAQTGEQIGNSVYVVSDGAQWLVALSLADEANTITIT